MNGSHPVQIYAEISVILSDRVRRNHRKDCLLCHCDVPYVWLYEIWSCKNVAEGKNVFVHRYIVTDTGIRTALIASGGSFHGSKASEADRSTSNSEIL